MLEYFSTFFHATLFILITNYHYCFSEHGRQWGFHDRLLITLGQKLQRNVCDTPRHGGGEGDLNEGIVKLSLSISLLVFFIIFHLYIVINTAQNYCCVFINGLFVCVKEM